jgi:hypothetical protein
VGRAGGGRAPDGRRMTTDQRIAVLIAVVIVTAWIAWLASLTK